MSVEASIRAELDALGAADVSPFDVHSHTGIDVDGSARSAEEHVRELERIGGRSVVFPLCVNTGYGAENRRVIEECRRHSERLVPFARLDPKLSGAPAAAAALGSGARGIKLHPRAEDFRLDHPNVEAIFGVAAQMRAPVLIHAGSGVGSFGGTLVELAERHRECPIVLAHAGISDLAWLAPVVPEHPNLFFDTAWIVPADLLALFALVPPGRILYGSDAPYMDVELLLAITLRCARYSGLAEDTVALVMGGQLATLLAGEEPIDAGPAPGAPATALSPGQSRLVSLLSGAGGCMFGGGDPAQLLELALLAVTDDSSGASSSPLVVELIEEARRPSPEAMRAIVLALTMAMTPRVRREVLVS